MKVRHLLRILVALALAASLTVSVFADDDEENDNSCSQTSDIASIPGLLLWFAPEALPHVADGAPVGRWPDSSGNDFDAVQSSASRRPVYRCNSINGHPAVDFDGIDDVLKLTGSAVLQDISLFIVYRYHAPLDPGCQKTYPFSIGGDANVSGEYWGIETLSPCSGNSVDVADIYAGFSNDARATHRNISASGKVKQLTAISTGFIHDTEVFVNGKAAMMSATGFSVALNVPLTGSPESSWSGIGGGTYPGDNKAAAVEIAEVILFQTALDTDERRKVEKYLKSKYRSGD
ncbi:MAG TPA: hypothetical protein VGQ36_05710 [Thermoanaerobaculia bacterium]|jgi:hypothetical protein|nr:hypothetical protein [Thermoanaerobaculia bacterium]